MELEFLNTNKINDPFCLNVWILLYLYLLFSIGYIIWIIMFNHIMCLLNEQVCKYLSLFGLSTIFLFLKIFLFYLSVISLLILFSCLVLCCDIIKYQNIFFYLIMWLKYFHFALNLCFCNKKKKVFKSLIKNVYIFEERLSYNIWSDWKRNVIM